MIWWSLKLKLLIKILLLKTFLDTMKVEGRDPVKYLDDNVRPALLANFYLGRLASKVCLIYSSYLPDGLNNVLLILQQSELQLTLCRIYILRKQCP